MFIVEIMNDPIIEKDVAENDAPLGHCVEAVHIRSTFDKAKKKNS